MNAMTEYYYAKEREESAVERINDSYLEALNSLEKLEAENAEVRNDADLLRAMLSQVQTEKRCYMAENAKLRELVADVHEALCSDKAGMFHKLILASMEDDMRELGVEVDA